MGPKAFFELIDSPNSFVFSFVRNPNSRLVSCYADKFAQYPVTYRRGSMKDAHRCFSRELKRLPFDEPLPFPMFVDMACATNRTGTDGHWLLMDRMVPKDRSGVILSAASSAFRQICRSSKTIAGVVFRGNASTRRTPARPFSRQT
jgi:hypothetical protein